MFATSSSAYRVVAFYSVWNNFWAAFRRELVAVFKVSYFPFFNRFVVLFIVSFLPFIENLLHCPRELEITDEMPCLFLSHSDVAERVSTAIEELLCSRKPLTYPSSASI